MGFRLDGGRKPAVLADARAERNVRSRSPLAAISARRLLKGWPKA